MTLTPIGTFDHPTYVTAPPGDPDRLVAASQRAMSELHWQPQYPYLKEIIGQLGQHERFILTEADLKRPVSNGDLFMILPIDTQFRETVTLRGNVDRARYCLLLRNLLPLPALTAIHLVHRLGAIVVLLAAALAAWRLRNAAITGWPRRALLLALGLLGLQILTGISNVVLGWPLLAALLPVAWTALRDFPSDRRYQASAGPLEYSRASLSVAVARSKCVLKPVSLPS